MTALTPMMRQYLEIKKSYSDCILFFRLGDFYEMFFEDAEIASKELEIVLTGRDAGTKNRVPMCGVPYHAAENYIAKLIANGYKVAICEQTEDPKAVKGLVKREVIRVITPGTVLESNMLAEKENNFLAAICKSNNLYGLAYTDITTGEMSACEISSQDTLFNELMRLNPKEVIIQPLLLSENLQRLLTANHIYFNVNDEFFNISFLHENLQKYFNISSLEAFGLHVQSPIAFTVSALLTFIKDTQKENSIVFSKLKLYSPEHYMILDTATRKNLELTQAIRSSNKQNSLIAIIDYTMTAMGGRLIRNWLHQPLIHKESILFRQNAVEELVNNYFLRSEIRDLLKGVYDLERIAGRIAYGNATPRDLTALRNSLENIAVLQSILKDVKSEALKRFSECNPLTDIKDLLHKAISDNPPPSAKEEGIIKSGYNEEVDALRIAKREGKSWIAALEQKEKEKTGIKSLKVGYNKVFGYYIEITHANLANVPVTYIRKQTLANAERFITPELKEIEDKILGAEEKLLQLEYDLFVEIRKFIFGRIAELQELARLVAETDVFQSLAECAVRNNYTKPNIIDNNTLKIINGRHPVVEKTLKESFIANDCYLNNGETQFMLLTGPNMAGKSTYMRQIALIVLLAQIGSYVPAEEVEIGVIDRIFTRVGASDDLAMGQSTFMVEMIETANILNHSTEKSLVILDEIGRGTSTYDGLSIAWAVAEYLLKYNNSKTIFATHYHELTELTKYYPKAKNYHVAVKEKGEDILFIRKILPGATDRSYGIHVAKLAGLPQEVINRATEILSTLEKQSDISIFDKSQSVMQKPNQLVLFETEEKTYHPILTEIETLNIVNITPLEALMKINTWQKKLRER